MARRRTARETRGRQVEAAPEEVDRTGLADEAGPELLQHAVHLDQCLPEQVRVARVVRRVPLVLVERDRIGDLDRTGRDGDVHTPASKPGHEVVVEPCNGPRLELHREGAGVVIGHRQSVVDEVDVDLEGCDPRSGSEMSSGRVRSRRAARATSG